MSEKLAEIPLSRIEPNPFQPRKRFDASYIDFLSRSIRTQGLLQPIVVRQHPEKHGWYQIVAGECRTRATRLIEEAKTIKAYVRDVLDKEMLKQALLENMSRRDMNPMEEAEAVYALLDAGFNMEEISRATAHPIATLAEMQNLLRLLPELQNEVRVGRLNKKLGAAIGGLPRGKQLFAYKRTCTKILEKALDIVTVMLQEEVQTAMFFQLTPEEEQDVKRALNVWRRFKGSAIRLRSLMRTKGLLFAMKDEFPADSFMEDFFKSWRRFKSEVSRLRTKEQLFKEDNDAATNPENSEE